MLLAKLLARRGEYVTAWDVLTEFEQQHDSSDLTLSQMLICLSTGLNRHEHVDIYLTKLNHHAGHLPSIQHWIQTMEELDTPHRFTSIDPNAEQMAVELMDHLSVVPSLVAAAKLQPDDMDLQTLRSALAHVFRDALTQRDQILICEALADLGLLVGDDRDARRWAHRGRRIDAYHVRFALILGDLEDDPAVGPPASAALGEALRAHPHYPDVRAALIRREFADGQTAAARRRLQRWLDDQPEHPLALQLQQELAA